VHSTKFDGGFMKRSDVLCVALALASATSVVFANYCVKAMPNTCGGGCGPSTQVCDGGFTSGTTRCYSFVSRKAKCKTWASCALGAPGATPPGYTNVGCDFGAQDCVCTGAGLETDGPQDIIDYTNCTGTCVSGTPGGDPQ
jgi:hypothetical protein